MTLHEASSSLHDAKRAMRKNARERRSTAHESHGQMAGNQMRDQFIAAITLPRAATIGSYWPFRDEIDCAPLLHHFHENDHEVGLPAVVATPKGRPPRPMVFRPWRPGMRLAKGRLGEPTPPPDADYGAGDLTPGVLLVPLLAFDRRGRRIGYGGGNFDATIAHLRSAGTLIAIGLAYADQEVETVPTEDHDEPLDWVVTERSAIEIVG